MGQQQLLLVILVTIIVGIATVVAINVFGSSAENANLDAVRQDVLTIGTAAQGWYIKPTMMGGGGNSFVGMTFRDITFAADTINAAGDMSANMNGTYALVSATADSVTVDAYPASRPGYVEFGTGSSKLIANISKASLTWEVNN